MANQTPKRWLDLFRLIPGYDPVATAPEGWWFDPKRADDAVRFFSSQMTHIEGKLAGQPFDLQPWQAAHVGCAFGWRRPGDTRRYREVFDFEPRKNGKTAKLGGLINMVALCDHEPGAQIYSAAAEREQAALVFRQAKGMLLNKPKLARLAKVYATFRTIEYPGGVTYKALSADADTKHGFNTHFVVVDELHAQPDRELVDVLVTSTGSRRQPLVWYITTSDYARPSICNEKYDYACKVRDGIIEDPSFLPIIYEAPADADWTDPETWKIANPNLGVSVSLEYLERECKRAQETPAYENTFRRLHLNQRTEQDVRAIPMEKWDAGAPPDPLAWRREAEERLKGGPCLGGLDLGSTADLTALALLFKDEDGYTVLPSFWVPRESARKRERRDRVPYETWIRQGWVIPTEGDVTDYDQVRADVNRLAETFGLRELAVDRLFQGAQLCTQLQQDGLSVIAFGQGFLSMAAPTKHFLELVTAGKLRHGGNPVLRWMASNAATEQDAAGSLKFSKKKSAERIDGIVAVTMGLGRWLVAPEGGSVYDDHGIDFIG